MLLDRYRSIKRLRNLKHRVLFFLLDNWKGEKMSIENDYFGEKTYKSSAIRAAKELGYGDDIIKRIEAAKSSSEIECIMVGNRLRLSLKEAKG